MKQFAVYIVTNKKHGTPYIGMTANLPRRDFEHKNKVIKGFTAKYNLDKLVYYELYETALEAITREKVLKTWRRARKIHLIESINPEWKDLSEDLNN